MWAKLKFVLFFIFVLLITTNLDAFGDEEDRRDLGFITKYMVTADGQSFKIIFGSNFQVSSHMFSAHDKMLQFNIETSLDERNIGEIIIPRDLIDGEFTVLLDGKEISHKLSNTSKTSVITVIFDGKGNYTLDIIGTKYLEIAPDTPDGGGCLIATATFGSEMAPQVQLLREIRDSKIMQTQSGSVFMNGFNQFYYSFSPTVSDYERENIIFKEYVKLVLTPLLTSLSILQYVDIDSESEMLGYGISLILLNIGLYFIAPTILIMKIRKRVNMEKLDQRYV